LRRADSTTELDKGDHGGEESQEDFDNLYQFRGAFHGVLCKLWGTQKVQTKQTEKDHTNITATDDNNIVKTRRKLPQAKGYSPLLCRTKVGITVNGTKCVNERPGGSDCPVRHCKTI
tara:strand:+ start:67 stop:417 length:351 start_codon:yes stop_codon:yes gene_type:complete